MLSIIEITGFFGFYKSNKKFDDWLITNIGNFRYDNLTQYISDKKNGPEFGFSNERTIRESDKNKPLMGGKPVFTHFNIFSKASKVIDKLPFEVNFNDDQKIIRTKAGKPDEIIDVDVPILGHSLSDHYYENNIEIIFIYKNVKSIECIQIKQREKFILENTKLSLKPNT